MENVLRWLGRLAGIGGVLLGFFAVLARLQGAYTFGGFQTGTMLLAAIFVIALACLAYLAALAEFRRR
ncbi:MAG TPA: hypothetical protein VN324_02685 [Quisquiliibacterium sp.]|nr:hypothetical protein [Quisquiliibacterium sp.]